MPLLVAVWLGGVVLATGAGLLAVRLVDDEVGDPPAPTLSSKEVAQALASAPASSKESDPLLGTQLSPTTSEAAGAPAAARSFNFDGGSVGVRCRGTAPEQVYASPAQGYRLDESSVKGSTLEVKFESGSVHAQLKIGCDSSSPVLLSGTEPGEGSD